MGTKICGILPALVTPFGADGHVDETVARELIEYLLGQGADGFYVLGSTGEGLLMREEERRKMCEIAVSQVGGRKPVICHIAAMNFEEAVRLAKHAESVGADAVSAIPPVFFGYSENDVYEYYKKLAQSTDLPFIVYNHVSVGGGMRAELVAKLFEIDRITGVKWTVPNYYELLRLKDMTHGEMNIINGPDETLVAGLCAGADAGIGTTYNVMLPKYLEIYRSVREGKIDRAREVQIEADRVIDVIIKYGVISTVKYMCCKMGFDVGNATFPLAQLPEEQTAAIDAELARSGWTA